jgi:hypothetical protein
MPTRFALTARQQDGLRELADGHPALLQNACYLLFNIWRANTPFNADRFARDFTSATEQFFQNAWFFATDAEKTLLMLIALSRLQGRLNNTRRYDLDGLDNVFSQMDRELRDLEEHGVVKRAMEKGRAVYSFASSIMEWWVIKEIENSRDVAELEQREKVFVNLNRKQIEQVKNVLQQVWQYKDAAVSMTGWLGKLVGAFTKGVARGGAA